MHTRPYDPQAGAEAAGGAGAGGQVGEASVGPQAGGKHPLQRPGHIGRLCGTDDDGPGPGSQPPAQRWACPQGVLMAALHKSVIWKYKQLVFSMTCQRPCHH